MSIKKQPHNLIREMQPRVRIYIYALAAVIFALSGFGINIILGSDAEKKFNQKAALLEEEFSKKPALGDLTASLCESQYIIFFSICDTHNRATVINGKGITIKEAWQSAAKETRRFVQSENYDPVWVKVDIVVESEAIKTSDLSKKTKNLYDNYFRKGIALDNSFSTAFLEAEINSNKIIDYDNNTLDLNNMNKYLSGQNRETLSAIPEQLILFSCLGFLCDENNLVWELSAAEQDYGRRIQEVVDKNLVMGLISTSSQFLANWVQDDGRFIYGYYPTYDNKIDNYNILRHTGTIWSLIAHYKTTRDETLIPKIESTTNLLVSDYMEYPKDDIAFVVERKSDEVKLGGNGIAVVMLIDYMEQLGNDKYKELATRLGNGILSLQDAQSGQFYHVLNAEDYSLKDENRTVYYDGEATFALIKLYGLTRDEKYLNGAKKAIDYFIANNYAQYRDHWVAYSMNEITKYAPEERYYAFALQNANENLDTISTKMRSTPTYLELLMATFSTYDRIKQNNISVEYMKQFNEKYFLDTINKRVRHQLNGYMYPEYAMYLKKPDRIVNTFYIRDDGFRIRIDDVQHFIGGYYAYYNNYDKIEMYREQLGGTI